MFHPTLFNDPDDESLRGEIVCIVREAIEAGLIGCIDLDEFDTTIPQLSSNDLEDYLQDLWDQI